MVGDDVPYLLGAEIESEMRMMGGGILVGYQLVPCARVDDGRDMLEAPRGGDERDAVLQWYERFSINTPLGFVVDIDADLEQFQGLQILQDEQLMGREFFPIHRDGAFVYVEG